MKKILFAISIFICSVLSAQVKYENKQSSARTNYGLQRLKATVDQLKLSSAKHSIVLLKQATGKKESFTIETKNNKTTITGNDESGILYGCLAFADQLKATKKFPSIFSLSDAPEMVLRGACIGVQKPYYLPGRTVYEYPYTPETFPCYYDKKLWIQYLE